MAAGPTIKKVTVSGHDNPVNIAIDAGIAILTLNRPEKLNALSRVMIADIIAALDELEKDDAVRAVIFTGAGRAFCAGADLASAGPSSFDYARREDASTSLAGEVEPDWGG